jgi:hypothetical protein
MSIRNLLLTLWMAGTLAAQSFKGTLPILGTLSEVTTRLLVTDPTSA